MKDLKIKVCGMRDPDNIRQLVALGIDYIGFIFHRPSPRYALPLAPEAVEAVPPQVQKVGVFVDDNPCTVASRLQKYALQAAQLHGDETPEYCRRIKEETGALNIKAVAVDGQPSWGELEAYHGAADYLLFDTHTEERGGSGRRWQHHLLEEYPLDIPWFLSGGLDSDILDTPETLRLPGLHGLDLNSRFETAPAMKDIEKIKTFLEKLRS
jgi:phosphoribosylanthranilate isomerase